MIDTAANELSNANTLTVGEGIEGVAVDSSGSAVYVANSTDGIVSIIEPR